MLSSAIPNAVHTYYPTKDALLDALLDSLLAEIETGHLDSMGCTRPSPGSWTIRATAVVPSAIGGCLPTRPSAGPNAGRLGEMTFVLSRAGAPWRRGGCRFSDPPDLSRSVTAAFQAPRLGDEERSRRGEAAFAVFRPRIIRRSGHWRPFGRPPDDERFSPGSAGFSMG